MFCLILESYENQLRKQKEGPRGHKRSKNSAPKKGSRSEFFCLCSLCVYLWLIRTTIIRVAPKKKSDTANSSKDKVEEDDKNEDGEDEDQLDDDDEQDEGEDSDEQDAEENDEENGEESEDAERGLSATEKEVVRRAIQRTVTIVNADHNVTYRVTRRSARLNAGK